MAKARTKFVCSACGADHAQWFGRCPKCHEYGTLQEEVVNAVSSGTNRRSLGAQKSGSARVKTGQPQAALTFSQIHQENQGRFPSGYGELDRVLGGGIVPGALILIGGDPGIGKSTLLLQVAFQLATRLPRILYVSAEESGQQIKLRATRLGITQTVNASDGTMAEANLPHDGNLFVLPETNLEDILRELEALQPQVAIIDSIQNLYFPALSSAPGSVSQVRECTGLLMQLAKRDHISLFIVGHVTKEGAIAGPKVLEHLVDTVLYFQGDRFASHRLLRSVKNRFGATQEIGIFEMVQSGLQEVLNPSQLFLGSREEFMSGTAITVACEGTRPLVVELQALVSPTSYASPRRSTTGVDYNRLLQVLAVLEKRLGVPLSKLDAYLSVAGGLEVEEPAVDLAMAIALVASFRDRVVDPTMIILGEIGLGGQIRPISQLEIRLKEAAKLGFKKAIVPKGQTGIESAGIKLIPVGKVFAAIAVALPANEDTSTNKEMSIKSETPPHLPAIK
ncbi:DNA repair protein RadA [Synechocystis sp. FACHB-383]|uniref:DNA repair protein RadA n=1 Tax=Synechocystis sp. FACHB-383 TaxID=2692864 RepID=UPI001689E011|nr:DNA repair protein RadA [Synechocystis sp. FACHB-383]MBD2654873.1 DNA repair protein RadA [Synechocystis sp. FACHB-383]